MLSVMTRRMSRALLLTVLAGSVAFAMPASQQTQRSIGTGGAPTTVIDFAAVDAKGQPISDLAPGDITVTIGGKPRAVKDLQFVKSGATGGAGDPLPAPFASNVSTGGGSRAALLIIDSETLTTGLEQRVRDGLTAYINTLGPQDAASISTVPHGGITVPFTTDHAKLKEAAAKIIGARNASETGEEAACRSRLTVQAMQSILQQRADSDTPTDVIFVSSSMSGPRNNVTSGNTRLGRGGIGACELPQDEFTRLATSAASARARIYIVQPEKPGSTAAADESSFAGLEGIASLTGGYIWHMAGSDEPGFQRIAAETSSYYNATVEVDPADLSSAQRPIAIKTSRADVTLRVRPTVMLTKSAAGAPAKSAPAPKDMLRTATVYRDVPLRLSAFASRVPASAGGAGKVRIMAVGETGVPGTKLSAAAVGLYDNAGKLVGQWTATPAELAGSALIATFDQNPGTYRARVAVTDVAGRAGAADVPVDANLTPAASGLSLSSVVIGLIDNGFTPKLQFTNEPTATVYFELYGGKPGMPVSVAVELASTLNGPALATLQPKISASPEPDKYLIITPVNLGALPPGDYIVRAIVGLDGFPATRILRTLRKTQ
jgi:VWFA-related protein